METPTKDRLKKKLKKKQTQDGTFQPEPQEDVDIFKMISEVQKILKTNPELVNKVSNCVNSLMTNSEIMQQLSTQIEKTVVQDQTNLTSSSGSQPEAS